MIPISPTTADADGLLPRLRAALAAAGDPATAEGARAYMKSAMPYHGVKATPQRAIFRQLFAEVELATAEAWRAAVLGLWRDAEFREERYAALRLAGDRRFARFQTLDALPMYEEIVVTGAWWDYVDDVAAHRLPVLLRRFPGEMRREMLAWSRGGDIWKRRAAILCQLPLKRDTDLDLLERCIEPSLGRAEFWLRKAIGWALRQHARTDPGWVMRYVREHAAELSPLSKREALKQLLRSGAADSIP
ncbi:DNA alkylation repair protein [Longimicrobium sp.]|uniref:DNA alkylation repair protein n=1 Tax=Longimicrobium sp. TaxID=2029185 RepID=UPI002C4C1372|nr:DNA alkylation repair protein [Longimicrobium sp.]HSU15600.1 DNA alkylation repair protein [Longimicrobium sp.]